MRTFAQPRAPSGISAVTLAWLAAAQLGACTPGPPPPSGAAAEVAREARAEPYPELAEVPPRPRLGYTVQQKRAIAGELVADREHARYEGETLRHRLLGAPAPAPPPPRTAAAAPVEPRSAPAPARDLTGETARSQTDTGDLDDFLDWLFGTGEPEMPEEPEPPREAAAGRADETAKEEEAGSGLLARLFGAVTGSGPAEPPAEPVPEPSVPSGPTAPPEPVASATAGAPAPAGAEPRPGLLARMFGRAPENPAPEAAVPPSATPVPVAGADAPAVRTEAAPRLVEFVLRNGGVPPAEAERLRALARAVGTEVVLVVAEGDDPPTSLRRAREVARLLVAFGLDPARIELRQAGPGDRVRVERLGGGTISGEIAASPVAVQQE